MDALVSGPSELLLPEGLSCEAGLLGAGSAWFSGAALASKLMVRRAPKPVPLGEVWSAVCRSLPSPALPLVGAFGLLLSPSVVQRLCRLPEPELLLSVLWTALPEGLLREARFRPDLKRPERAAGKGDGGG